MVKRFMALVLAVFMGCCLCVGCRGYTKNGDYYELETDTMVRVPKCVYDLVKNSIGDPILLKHEDSEVVFSCTVDYGEFVLLGDSPQYTKEVCLRPNDGLYWQPTTEEDIEAFVEIILNKGENIIGYAVVEIYSSDSSGRIFSARTLKSVLFPKIEGEYQKVTEEDVRNMIEEIKNRNK